MIPDDYISKLPPANQQKIGDILLSLIREDEEADAEVATEEVAQAA